MAEARRLLILTRDRAGAAFRQRIEPYLGPLGERGIACEVAELSKCPLARRRRMRRAPDFDGVLLHRKTLTTWDAWALRGARRVIYDFDDAVMFQAGAPERAHPARLRRFRRTVTRADLVIAGSPVLADHARDAGARRVNVVPTGLDIKRYTPKQTYGADGPVRLVWIGSKSTLKQLRAAGAIGTLQRAAAPIVLRVIADAELDAEGLRVENLPWRLRTEARLLAESDIGIAPLPDTPYTRGKCAFKVVQYMAAGLPVIASPVGANAAYVRPEETGLWAESAEEWVAAVEKLAADPSLRERLGRAGRRRAEAEFDFSVLAPKVCDSIQEALR